MGAVSEKVEVTAEAAQVDTSSSALGGFVNSATIRELPLNGRDWLQLALLQPGVNFNAGQTQADTQPCPARQWSRHLHFRRPADRQRFSDRRTGRQ